jgi:hypothetical protein
MTTFYPFIPSNIRAPSFMATFDGQIYTVTLLWNISGQRYYVNCQSVSGTLVFMVPLVESIPSKKIESLSWDEFNGVVIVTLDEPHGFPIGEIVNVTIVQAIPNTYNGSGLAMIINDTAFTYPMAQDPGYMQQGGAADFVISMTKAYFNSTLVFRNMQFEISP